MARLRSSRRKRAPKLCGGPEGVVDWPVDEHFNLGHEVPLFATGSGRGTGGARSREGVGQVT